MNDDAPLDLICLVEGESSPFIVTLTGSRHIMVLKDFIKEKRKNGVLNSVDATDLTLWKVDLAISEENELKGLIGKNVPDSVRLRNAFDHISVHWPATTPHNPDHLHIIVELPSVLGKRFHDAADDLSLEWLDEPHSKIRRREDLRPQLFRKVKVTGDHYATQGTAARSSSDDYVFVARVARNDNSYDSEPDYYVLLNNLLQHHPSGNLTPRLSFRTTQEGVDRDATYIATAIFCDQGYGVGKGKSRAVAKQIAAKAIYELFSTNGVPGIS